MPCVCLYVCMYVCVNFSFRPTPISKLVWPISMKFGMMGGPRGWHPLNFFCWTMAQFFGGAQPPYPLLPHLLSEARQYTARFSSYFHTVYRIYRWLWWRWWRRTVLRRTSTVCRSGTAWTWWCWPPPAGTHSRSCCSVVQTYLPDGAYIVAAVML